GGVVMGRAGGPWGGLVQAGRLAGWVAVLLSMASGFWYIRWTAPRWGVHVLGVGGLLLGVVAACFASLWDTGNWLSHRVLTTTWSLLGLAVLALGWMGSELRVLGPAFWSL